MIRAALLAAALAAAGCTQPTLTADMPKPEHAPPLAAQEPAVPQAPKAPEVPKTPEAAKAPEAPKAAVPAAPVSKTPIVVDLQKVKWAQEGEVFGWDDGDSRLHYWANGTGSFAVAVPADGDYEIIVSAASQPALNVHAAFKVEADGKPVGAETTCTSEDAKDYKFSATLAAGERKISVTFTNDVYKENEYDRNFFLHGLKLVRMK